MLLLSVIIYSLAYLDRYDITDFSTKRISCPLKTIHFNIAYKTFSSTYSCSKLLIKSKVSEQGHMPHMKMYLFLPTWF
jgi:hypothetical protein